MKHYSYFILPIVFLVTGLTSAQLDSVYHQGPKLDSVLAGAMQTTDNFTASMKKSTQIKMRDIPNKIIPKNEMFINVDKSKLPNYVYVQDKNATKHPTAEGQTVLLNSFNGFDYRNVIPPDPTLAVGPNHVILCANGSPSTFRIYDKEGNLLKEIGADDWWADVSPGESGDPQVIYDPFEGRWILSWLYVNSNTQTSATLISYSDDDDPLGTWYVYTFPNVGGWGDYPQLGFDDEAIYINTNQFSWSGGFQYHNMRIINKAELYASNGGKVKYKDFWDIRRPGDGTNHSGLFSIHPTYSYTSGDEGYHFWAVNGSANFYCIFQVINPTSDYPRLRGAIIPVDTYSSPPDANQLGGGTPLIETSGSQCRTAPIVKDGVLFVTHSIENSTDPDYASVKYVILDLNTQSIIEQAEFGAVGYFYFYPTLAIDQNYNIAVTFSRSADDEYIGAYYSTKYFGDPPGLSPSKPFAEGKSNYVKAGSDNRNRWGDYMGIYLDPANDFDIWMHTEYAAPLGQWATQFAQIRMVPYSTAHIFANPVTIDFGDIERGVKSRSIFATLANYGTPDLVINNIPSTVGDFSLENNITFPLTLSAYDSLLLEFTCTPGAAGSTEENFAITSNDTQFGGFTLKGNGFIIYPALDKVIYSSSGPQNSGQISTLNKLTGEGTNIGMSSYEDIVGLSINPINKKLYAARSSSLESQILIVNIGKGDSYVLFSFDLPDMSAIAFDKSGTLYTALKTGEIYSIDLTDGSYQLVSTSKIGLQAMVFDPVTNELWGTVISVFGAPKDKIFKIDVNTGDTTFVGQTGFNTTTNDLFFDENGVLYGVKGTGSQVCDLFTIDTNTGVGTIIGSTGLKSVSGLAYAETGITSVKPENKNILPDKFVLSQNYPNPFNPSTTIKFSIPFNSNIKLTVYNLLGQVIKVLANEDVSAGNYSVIWNGTDNNGLQVSSGIYFYELKAKGNNGTGFSKIMKMVYLK